jgi:Fe-S cluster biogenesis protein NfuA
MAGPAKTDAPFYTEEELDALDAADPLAAARIAREQLQLRKRLAACAAEMTGGTMPDLRELDPVISEIRNILRRDGGDIECLALEEGVLTVRLRGSCSGCPRAPLDLKHVVEAMVRARFPQITAVRNVY